MGSYPRVKVRDLSANCRASVGDDIRDEFSLLSAARSGASSTFQWQQAFVAMSQVRIAYLGRKKPFLVWRLMFRAEAPLLWSQARLVR